MSFDFKAATPVTSGVTGAYFWFGATSQAAATPDIFTVQALIDFALSNANSWTATQTYTAATTSAVFGANGGNRGVLQLKGNTSGTVTVQPAAAAGTWTLTLPTTGGTNTYFLQTNGSGTTTWAAGLAPGGSSTQVQYSTGSALGGDSTFTFNSSTKLLSFQQGAVALGTITDPATILALTATWNDAADTFDAFTIDVTNTASATASRLLRLMTAGTNRFSIDRLGNIAMSSGNLTVSGASTISFDFTTYFGGASAAASRMQAGASAGAVLTNVGAYNWSSTGAANGSVDLSLFRDGAAYTLAQRLGTNAQVHRIYATYTDASNYERVAIQTGSGYVELAAETAGTGTDDLDVRLTPAGTGNVNFPGGTLLKTRAALTNGAAAQTGTLTNGPAAGNPTKWIPINDNGTTRYIPAW